MRINLILLLFLTVGVKSVYAQKEANTHNVFLRVYNLEGKKISKGSVIFINDTLLALKNSSDKTAISMKDIGYIKTKRSAGHNILIGSAIGTATGAILGAASADPDAWIFGYTAAETILLQVAGMSFFDAINHALSTLSTGGFSTKNASVAFWNGQPVIQYIIIVFMFLAGTNFVLSYFAFKGKVQKIIADEEFKLYFKFIVVFTLIASLIIYFKADIAASTIAHPMVWGEAESAFRHGLFQVLAIITTTGFVSADYTLWTPFLTIFFLFKNPASE